MGLGPSSEAKSNYVQLVWTTTVCGGLKKLRGECPSWLKPNLEKIQDLGAPYGGCILIQMDCCGSPVCESPFEAQNEPLLEMRKQFPQYTFSFRPEWVGVGKGAHWEHILQITNAPAHVVGRVVGVPDQQNM